ncbi:DNA polymerase III subunit delta [Lujinxingia litoralis]|uniref:DNA polymerase III subunit delta n=1 Tax=Lujinxingia litoralis TaxID=2211119 RepID=A0A328C5Y5_9DELT|nr:DNA polymerase III subunit delta [Lujinxingia litoralis]RAL21711.1 DNA polymerase III subunit delta [Lujinxingia litoralis]
MSKKAERARQFFRDLKKGPVAPIYYVHGAETYLLDQAVEALIAAAAPEGTNAFNLDTFQGRSASGEAIRAAAEMLPMMSKRRLVVVRDMQEIPLSELAHLEDYFTNPSPTTCLILHARTAQKKIDGRSGVIRKLKKAAEVCEFEALYESDIPAFLEKQAASRGMRLSRPVTQYLVDAVGTDMAELQQALEKIDLYVGPRNGESSRQVDLDEVQEVIAHTRVRTVFDLTDALGERNYQKALLIMERMLLDGQSALVISHMIARHFRIVARLQDPSLRNANNSDAARAVGVSPFFVKDYQRHARTFAVEELASILRRMLEVDNALKSSPLPDRVTLEELFAQICMRALHSTG